MAESELFVAWVDTGAFASLEAQIVFEENMGTIDTWSADLELGQVSFTTATGTTPMSAQVLGSAAPGPKSWMWAWANTSISQNATTVAQQAQGYGERQGVPEFTTAELPLGDYPEGDQLWKRLAIAIGAIYPEWRTYFPAPIGGGSIAPMLLQHPRIVVPKPDIARVIRVITQGLQYTALGNHRRAVNGYARAHDLPIAWDDNVGTLTLEQGAVKVIFDEADRITNMSASAGSVS